MAGTVVANEAIVEGMKKTILITGVSKGLGRALNLEMVKRGHTIIGCSRSQEKLDALRLELLTVAESSTPPFFSLTLDTHLLMNVDMTSNSGVEEFARVIKEKNIVPDIIVNNAGIINENNDMWKIPAEEFDAVIDTNIKGTANVLRHFIPLMMETNQGIIVNMSSAYGKHAVPYLASYCASKWGIEGLTKSVAKELPDGGMAIVALSPGAVNTEMLQFCYVDAALFQTPKLWAPKAATMILSLTAANNGASIGV